MLEVLTTAVRKAVCVTIPRDLFTALVKLDLLEMDTIVQVHFQLLTSSRIKCNYFLINASFVIYLFFFRYRRVY